MNFDFDYLIIGSGFGGSVSAMRLSQKGYRVAVLEAGKRFEDNDFPKTNWNLKKFLWMPLLRCFGIQRLNLLNDVLILSGAGVGGGSLVYANTLYVPPDTFFKHPILEKMGGKSGVLPYYTLAQKMLGVVENDRLGRVDELMLETAKEFDAGETFKPTPVGVYYGERGREGVLVSDPYFQGEGPERRGCIECGGCMVGCRHNAKNTLVKNYLHFAESFGTIVIPESRVTEVIPLNHDGSAGYRVNAVSSTHPLGYPNKSWTAKGVVFSAGVLGTLNLLLKQKEQGLLPRLSARLGKTVRTNSEAILGALARDKQVDYSKGIAITSSVYPDADSHIEPVRYPKGSDAMGFLATIITDGGGKIPRQLRFVLNALKRPRDFLTMSSPFGFAQRGIIVLFMQTLDNSIEIVRKRRWFWPFKKSLGSAWETGIKAPSYIPIANEFTKKLAEKMDAIPGSTINEVLLDVPTTAHILGGCGISDTPEDGVIDLQNRVFGYANMLVCDGSMIPANLGVNPSLTITSLTERAMAFIPPKSGQIKVLKAEQTWGLTELMQQPQALSPSLSEAPAVDQAAESAAENQEAG